MKTRSLLAVAAFCAALALPGIAAAQSVAYAAGDGYTNLRSGPSTNYPVIARVYPGSPVDVLGCLETRAWCDVVVEDIRGWIYASRLEFVYGGRRVYVPDYYTYFGAPIIQFRFGDYGRDRDHRRHDRRHRQNWDYFPNQPDPNQGVASPPYGGDGVSPPITFDGSVSPPTPSGPGGGNLPCNPNIGCPE